MNRIEKLIGELCPDGVEWKELGEVVEILDYLRKPISKDKGNLEYIHTMSKWGFGIR